MVERIPLTPFENPESDVALAIPARPVSATASGWAARAGAADRIVAAVGIILCWRPVVEIGIGFADLTGIGGVLGLRGDIHATDPAVWAAFLAAGRAATLGGRAALGIAADPTRHTAASGLVEHERPIEAILLRITDLAGVGGIVLVLLERLPLDLALIRAGIDRALDAIAAFGRRAALGIAARSAFATERAILGGRPIVAIPGRRTELAGVLGIDDPGVEGLSADDAAARDTPLGGAAFARPAADIVAAIPPKCAASRAAGGESAVAAHAANATVADGRSVRDATAHVVAGSAIEQIRCRVNAARPAGGRLIGRACATAVRSTDAATAPARLADLAGVGHASADAVNAGWRLAVRRSPAWVQATAAVVYIGLVLLGGDAIAAAFLGSLAADTGATGGIARPGAAVGVRRATLMQRHALLRRRGSLRQQDRNSAGRRSVQECFQRFSP